MRDTNKEAAQEIKQPPATINDSLEQIGFTGQPKVTHVESSVQTKPEDNPSILIFNHDMQLSKANKRADKAERKAAALFEDKILAERRQKLA